MVNEGYQVFDKITGASIFGPASILSIWSGFGGVCQTGGNGDPVVMYDQLANRWLISQFAGGLTHECVAVSTTSDATGSYARYDYNLVTIGGSALYDYPHFGVWPDAYYDHERVQSSGPPTRPKVFQSKSCAIRRPKSGAAALPAQPADKPAFDYRLSPWSSELVVLSRTPPIASITSMSISPIRLTPRLRSLAPHPRGVHRTLPDHP
jgi:hypothetical protein